MQREEFMAERGDLLSRFAQECAARDRLAEAVRGMRETDARLRAQVVQLEKLRDGYAEERAAALALVRAGATNVEYTLTRLDDDYVIKLHVAWLTRARALLDGAA
jgi:hypothetical protein